MSIRQVHVRTAMLFLAAFVGILTLPSYAQKGSGPPSQQGPAGAQGGGGSSPYFETQMLAYGAVNQLSESISREVCTNIPSNDSTVIIFDQSSFQNLQAWQSFVASVHLLERAYGTLLPPDVAARIMGGVDQAALT